MPIFVLESEYQTHENNFARRWTNRRTTLYYSY